MPPVGWGQWTLELTPDPNEGHVSAMSCNIKMADGNSKTPSLALSYATSENYYANDGSYYGQFELIDPMIPQQTTDTAKDWLKVD